MKHAITVARGDGIGPEIMAATLHVLKESGADLDIHEVEIGEKVYLKGALTGIEPKTWETIKKTAAFLKAPITTPQGGGFKSLNVTIRTTLGLYSNIRPCVSYAPFIATKHPKMDVVIVRENEEDLYTGIEYRQTPDVRCSHKIITRQGCEKIIRYAFEYARHHGRKKVTAFTKDNIMKFSDGLFHQIYDEISKEYPDITPEHWIIDIGAAKLATVPENFDVLVLPNLYGDILSDVAAEITGSVGLAPSANIGDHGAMFEAIHGSAPRRAGQNVANPSGLLLASVMMMAYLGEAEIATRIHEAWLATIEEGIHTYDIASDKTRQTVGTKEFGEAVAKNLGDKPKTLKAPIYKSRTKIIPILSPHETKTKRTLVGVDVFIYARDTATIFQNKITSLKAPLKLQMITNRGARIWPNGHPETFCIEQWRCRFMDANKQSILSGDIVKLLDLLQVSGYDVIKTENLYTFDGKAGYSNADE